VRIFRTLPAGVLRLDDSVAISEARCGEVVLRHYAFADHWLKINVTTDLTGRLTETGDASRRFAANCDTATPIERDGDATFGVDLFADVLIRADGMSYVVADLDEFEDMASRHLLSHAESRGARSGLAELLELIEQGRLLRWLAGLAAFRRCRPPTALPMRRGPVPGRLQPGIRRTW
jgi:hypothetical protein